MIEFHVPQWNMECKRMTRLSPCFPLLDQICDLYMKNVPFSLGNFNRGYIYILTILKRLALLVSNQ